MEEREKLEWLGRWVKEHGVIALLESARHHLEEMRRREWVTVKYAEFTDSPSVHVTVTLMLIKDALYYLRCYQPERPTTLFEIFNPSEAPIQTSSCPDSAPDNPAE